MSQQIKKFISAGFGARDAAGVADVREEDVIG